MSLLDFYFWYVVDFVSDYGPKMKFHIRADGEKEFDNNDVNDFFAKKVFHG